MNRSEKVIKYLEEQKHDEAMKELNNIIQFGSDEEQLLLAEELYSYGYLEQAIELYKALLQSYPDEGELKLQLAELYIELGQDDQAYSYLHSISTNDPNYPSALLLEADLYGMQGLHEVSENKLKQAKKLLPNEPIIDLALGELFMTQGRFLEATRCFRQLLEAKQIKIGHVNIHNRMAEALSAGGAFEEALPYYEKAIKDKVDSDTLFGYGLTAYQAGQYNKAINILKQLEERDPDYHTLYLYLAKSFEHEELLKEAMEAVNSGLALDEFNKDLFFYGGKLALKLGDESKAEQLFNSALALDPEYVEAGLTLNKLLLHQERYEEVIDLSTQFIESGVTDPRFYWDSAFSLEKMEYYQEALKHYELAYNDFKNNQDFLVDYGYFLLEEGKTKEATHIFKQLVKMNPSNYEWVTVLERLLED